MFCYLGMKISQSESMFKVGPKNIQKAMVTRFGKLYRRHY